MGHAERPVLAMDTAGAKVWEASYLPFGGVETSTGANSDLRFPGQWFQSETGLHQNWMRDYDPTLGRYIQADPLGLVDGPATATRCKIQGGMLIREGKRHLSKYGMVLVGVVHRLDMYQDR